MKYWLRQPYLGFGLDAHSMLRTLGGETVRFQIGDDLSGYLDGAGLAVMFGMSLGLRRWKRLGFWGCG